MDTLNNYIPIISLFIAALAVIFGPLISIHISSKQNLVTSAIAKKNIISPIRQNWINELRQILARITHSYAAYWTEEDESKKEDLHIAVRQLRAELTLYINPNEEDHQVLLGLVGEMEAAMFGSDSSGEPSEFWYAHQATVEQAQKILKTEWETVKNKI
ncbi:hypothetical protein [Pseudohongiella sp.]|uniref:hypothetical protein n=1 Tax=Pseudohongiella sp. TaxID=1979412 RepID=UPI0018136879|nr:hypothetical protein [Pseudohongiella sp.]HDZ08257.1 hypothetical protein [Pseudohongiella sp.]HEA62534.1 hypothetical protein [Pseudohongiella sp.]